MKGEIEVEFGRGLAVNEPHEGEILLMAISRWEAQRQAFEATVREATVEVPDAAHAVVDSLDGVRAPMRGGYREAGCAAGLLVDGNGQRLHSVRMGRMPESHKATLMTMVAAEVEAAARQAPRPCTRAC
jgi:hypothetical protein